MPEQTVIDQVLANARVDDAVFALRPDYRALLIAVDGLTPGPGDDVSEALLADAEAATRAAVATGPVDELPHIAAWRDAYRAFGAKPQRTRNSVEALLRRAESGLPRVNKLTDVYNAISVLHQIPLGGEDLAHYSGAPRLIRATGTEDFVTTAAGEDVTEHPLAGEVVWCDDDGVTCRRWNWRQGRRTQLTDATTTALFILDALDPLTDIELNSAGTALCTHLQQLGPAVTTHSRILAAPGHE